MKTTDMPRPYRSYLRPNIVLRRAINKWLSILFAVAMFFGLTLWLVYEAAK